METWKILGGLAVVVLLYGLYLTTLKSTYSVPYLIALLLVASASTVVSYVVSRKYKAGWRPF